MTLVGKDQDTIVDAIKDLAENAEKVKAQEFEIKELIYKLDEEKEEKHYLKNKLDQKYDMIDDMENELDQMERNFKEAKKNLELRETDLKKLEVLINEQVEEINILRDNNLSMVHQVAENLMMEKKIKVQDAVIRDLRDKLNTETNNEIDEVTSERDRLLLEVDHLEKENEEKVKILESMENENVTLRGKLDDIQKNDELMNNSPNKTSLGEELKLVEELTENFECNICGKTFEARSELKVHVRKTHQIATWKSKLMEMETENSQLKYRLSLDLFRMKEHELKARKSCSCRGFCPITHSKHNWTKSHCDEIFINMEKLNRGGVGVNMHQCKTCEQNFLSPIDFIHHIENNHKTADVNFLQT